MVSRLHTQSTLSVVRRTRADPVDEGTEPSGGEWILSEWHALTGANCSPHELVDEVALIGAPWDDIVFAPAIVSWHTHQALVGDLRRQAEGRVAIRLGVTVGAGTRVFHDGEDVFLKAGDFVHRLAAHTSTAART